MSMKTDANRQIAWFRTVTLGQWNWCKNITDPVYVHSPVVKRALKYEQMTPPSLGALLKQEVIIDKSILFRGSDLPFAGVSAQKQKQIQFFCVWQRVYKSDTDIY